MQPAIFICFCLLASVAITSTYAVDHGMEGTKVILQTDVETAVISTPVDHLKRDLKHLILSSRKVAQSISISEKGSTNNLKGRKTGTKIAKLVLSTLRNNEVAFTLLDDQLTTLLDRQDEKYRTKRGIEFLGEMLSSITGVPSASDHRKLIEQVKLVKLESSEIKQLMSKLANNNKEFLTAMRYQQNEMATIAKEINHINEINGKLEHEETVLAVGLSMNAKAVTAIAMANNNLLNLREILRLNDFQRLSRFSINTTELTNLINTIYLERRQHVPIFHGKEIEQYYRLPLTHSWVSDDKSEIMTLLQIPIFDQAEKDELRVLDFHNKINQDLPVAVVNIKSNYFRYLSLSDLNKCLVVERTNICQKRKIRIFPNPGCSLELNNCRQWSSVVLHDISNTELLLQQPNATNATVECRGEQPLRVTLPPVAVLRVPVQCKLTGISFAAEQLSFQHIGQANNTHLGRIRFNVNEELQVVQQVSRTEHSHSKIKKNVKTLKELEQANNAFQKDLSDQIKISEIRWKEASGGWSGWEQITLWSLIASSFLMSSALAVWIISHRIKEQCVGDREEESRKDELNKIRERLIDLESEVHTYKSVK